MPALLITGLNDLLRLPATGEMRVSLPRAMAVLYYTSATGITKSWAESHGCEVTNSAVVFDAGASEAECRTYCSSDSGWPRVLDCRSDMGHTYEFSWTWPLVLEFFTAHSL